MKWRKQHMDESFFIAEDLMTVHGVLFKKGSSLVKKYKKRWFVLPDSVPLLQYYSAPNSKLQGHIDINNILSVEPLSSNKKHLHGFRITTPSRIYTLYAKTIEERDGWHRCLSHRLRIIATLKLSIQQVPIVLDDEDRNCQTFPKIIQRHSNSHLRDNFRDSPRRALSDGMLRSHNGKLTRYSPALHNSDPGAMIPEITVLLQDQLHVNPQLDSSRLTPASKAPINISNDDTRANVQYSESENADAGQSNNNSEINRSSEVEDAPSRVSSAEGSRVASLAAVDEALGAQGAQLVAKVGLLEHMCAEKDATIAALSAMLKRQSMASDLVRFRNSATTLNSPTNTGKKVQQHMDEFVGISMWLEQKKKTDLEKDVQQLRESNEELGALLEEERQKVQFLEQEKYNMQCMIEHLEKEKLKT